MGSIRHQLGALLCVPLVLGLGSVPVMGAQLDPTAESVAVDSLISAEDLAWPAEPTGIDVETDASVIDLPGYTDNGGLREVQQRWFDSDTFNTVFDFRFQFPDGASASAFLDASEEVLSEAASGAEALDPPVTPLDDTRYYRYEDRILGTETVGHNFLMRHGNLVAKVYVSGQGLPAGVASDVAQAAATRMVAAVGDDTPMPSGSFDPALDELLTHVPTGLRASCEPESPSVRTVTVNCPQSDELRVAYTLFDSAEAMDDWFDLTRMLVQANGADTSGDDCETGSYDGVWTLGGEEAGRLLCFNGDGNEAILWSHPDTITYSRIDHSGGDKAAAWDLWLNAGPE